MTRTALSLTRDDWRAYQPGTSPHLIARAGVDKRWTRAWATAQHAAHVLRAQFAATRVRVFGSLAQRAWFTPWSDIDLAVWNIPADTFYRAVAAVTGLSPEFKIDLIAAESCSPALQQVIEREGVDL